MCNQNGEGLRFQRLCEWKSFGDHSQQSSKRSTLGIEKRKVVINGAIREGTRRELWRQRELQRNPEKRMEVGTIRLGSALASAALMNIYKFPGLSSLFLYFFLFFFLAKKKSRLIFYSVVFWFSSWINFKNNSTFLFNKCWRWPFSDNQFLNKSYSHITKMYFDFLFK